MSNAVASTAPDLELPASANAVRGDAMNGFQQRDATDVMRMLFRSECFLEDLDEDAYSCAMH